MGPILAFSNVWFPMCGFGCVHLIAIGVCMKCNLCMVRVIGLCDHCLLNVSHCIYSMPGCIIWKNSLLIIVLFLIIWLILQWSKFGINCWLSRLEEVPFLIIIEFYRGQSIFLFCNMPGLYRNPDWEWSHLISRSIVC